MKTIKKRVKGGFNDCKCALAIGRQGVFVRWNHFIPSRYLDEIILVTPDTPYYISRTHIFIGVPKFGLTHCQTRRHLLYKMCLDIFVGAVHIYNEHFYIF